MIGGTTQSHSGESGAKRAFLVRKNTGERIQLKAPEFHLGRDPEFADYCFSERDIGVGKSHAIIYSRNGQYYVRDLKSLNGTFINGEQIPGDKDREKEHVIKSGDTISFANIDFVFKVE